MSQPVIQYPYEMLINAATTIDTYRLEACNDTKTGQHDIAAAHIRSEIVSIVHDLDNPQSELAYIDYEVDVNRIQNGFDIWNGHILDLYNKCNYSGTLSPGQFRSALKSILQK